MVMIVKQIRVEKARKSVGDALDAIDGVIDVCDARIEKLQVGTTARQNELLEREKLNAARYHMDQTYALLLDIESRYK